MVFFMGVWERKMDSRGIHSIPAPATGGDTGHLVIQDSGTGRRKLYQDATGATTTVSLPSPWDLRSL